MLAIVAETVIHEFGHYFGLSEEEIEEIEERYWNGEDLDDEPREREKQRRGGGAGGHDDRQTGLEADPSAREQRGRQGERRNRDAVDQAEHHEGETEAAHAGGAARVATNHRDAHGVVESAREDGPDQSGTAVAGRKRERVRPLVRREQPSPTDRLQSLCDKQKQTGRDEDRGLAA